MHTNTDTHTHTLTHAFTQTHGPAQTDTWWNTHMLSHTLSHTEHTLLPGSHLAYGLGSLCHHGSYIPAWLGSSAPPRSNICPPITVIWDVSEQLVSQDSVVLHKTVLLPERSFYSFSPESLFLMGFSCLSSPSVFEIWLIYKIVFSHAEALLRSWLLWEASFGAAGMTGPSHALCGSSITWFPDPWAPSCTLPSGLFIPCTVGDCIFLATAPKPVSRGSSRSLKWQPRVSWFGRQCFYLSMMASLWSTVYFGILC